MNDHRVTYRTPRWLRDPLVVFLLAGCAVFAIDYWRNSGDDAHRIIDITAAQVDGIRARWTAQFGREPTGNELEALLDEAVREEILYREALRLALDRNDAIVRRRLAQKMTFMLEDTAAVGAPDAQEVAEYYAEQVERYREPRRTTFMHVFVSDDRRNDPTSDARTLLRELQRGDAQNWRQFGDPFMLRREYADRTDREITELFGGAFTAAISELSTGGWAGPVTSAYGTHLVRVINRTASTLPALDAIRGQVVRDLVDSRRREENQAAFEALRERYEVRLPATP